jgi:hypothetical protein
LVGLFVRWRATSAATFLGPGILGRSWSVIGSRCPRTAPVSGGRLASKPTARTSWLSARLVDRMPLQFEATLASGRLALGADDDGMLDPSHAEMEASSKHLARYLHRLGRDLQQAIA